MARSSVGTKVDELLEDVEQGFKKRVKDSNGVVHETGEWVSIFEVDEADLLIRSQPNID